MKFDLVFIWNRLLVLVLITFSLLAWPLANVARADDPMPYDEYRALIARTYREAHAARSQSRAECAATLNRIADELEAVTAVRMPGGVVMPVEHCCGLDEALRATSCDVSQAEAFLAGICPGCINPTDEQGPGGQGQTGGGGGGQPGGSGAGGGGATGGGGPGQDTDGSGQPGGQGGDQGGQSQPSGGGGGLPNPMGLDMLRKILEELGLLPDSGGSGGPGVDGGGQSQPGDQGQPSDDGTAPGHPTQGGQDDKQPGQLVEQLLTIPIIVWLVAAIGVLLLVVGLAVLWMRRGAKPKPATRPDDDDADKKEDDVTSSVEAVDRAQQLVTVGDYRTAVRYLFLAALLALDERGLLRFDHALTNRELLRSAQANPILSAALAPVAVAFDRVWYGFEPLTQSDYETLVEQIETLNQL